MPVTSPGALWGTPLATEPTTLLSQGEYALMLMELQHPSLRQTPAKTPIPAFVFFSLKDTLPQIVKALGR